jgi:hypothetical protein
MKFKSLFLLFTVLFAMAVQLFAQTEQPTDPKDLAGWAMWLTGAVTSLSLFVARVWPPLANIKHKGFFVAALLAVVLVFLRQYGIDELKTYLGVIIGLLADQLSKAYQKWPVTTK